MDITKLYLEKNNIYCCSNFNGKTKKIILGSTKTFFTKKECEKEYFQRTGIKHEKQGNSIRRYSKKFWEKRYKF